MIPTGRLWVLLCLLAVPMMAAGFFPGLGGAVLVLDVLALALAGVDFLMARRVRLEVSREAAGPPVRGRAQQGGAAAGAPRRPGGGRARAATTCPRPSPPSPRRPRCTCPPDSQTRWVYRVSPAEARQVRLRGRARAGARAAGARLPRAALPRGAEGVGVPGPARRQPPAAVRRGVGPGEPGPAAASPGWPGQRVRPAARLCAGRLGARGGLEGHRAAHAGR